MSYYPKNKIKTNLYTNGNEFVLADNNEPYIGFYYSLYDGTFFTGKTPEDKPNRPLIIFNDATRINANTSIENITLDNPYNTLKNIDVSNIKLLPTSYYPQPTEDNYKLGEFQRYFVRKVNESLFLEVDKKTYNFINNKDIKYLFEYYIPFTFTWTIFGNRIDIVRINKSTVYLTEQQMNFKGLQEFLKFQFDKFYLYPEINNLETIGKELQYSNKTEYIGKYHIEKNRGFVIDSNPSQKQQPTLYPLDLKTEQRLLNQALNKNGYYINPTLSVYDSLKNKK